MLPPGSWYFLIVETNLVKVVWRVSDLVRLVPKPLYNILDSGKELLLFLLGIGVVVAKETDAVVGGCITEVDVDGLSVADVKNTVRFRGETGSNLSSMFQNFSSSRCGNNDVLQWLGFTSLQQKVVWLMQDWWYILFFVGDKRISRPNIASFS